MTTDFTFFVTSIRESLPLDKFTLALIVDGQVQALQTILKQ